jgi:hypothetical protein
VVAEYAPRAIRDLADQICAAIPSAKLAGILGDAQHGYGYHRARAVLPGDDYSVQLPEDRAGDAWAASALDISMSPVAMRLVTGRLLASAKDVDDPRLDVCREFFGTVDGRTVVGWDTYYGTPATSDDSHLWHVHVSFLRKYANDPAAMAAVLSVITGDDNMALAPDERSLLMMMASRIESLHQGLAEATSGVAPAIVGEPNAIKAALDHLTVGGVDSQALASAVADELHRRLQA